MKSGSNMLAEGKRSVLQIIFGRTMVIIVALALQFLLLFAQLYSLVQYIPYVTGGVYVLTAVMLIYVLNTKENPTVKLSWCILIGVLPVLGAVLYFFVRFELGHRLEKRIIQSSMEESLSFVPPQEEAARELREENKNLYNLSRFLMDHGGNSICRNTSVEYFPLGEAKFEAMLQELETAEKFIFLEYFIIGKGYMWSQVLDILTRKAAQGVDVRVMYDGTCAVTRLPYGYPRQLEAVGIHCKMFSPLRPFVSTHYNNRDHRKILVIDGRTAFTGGVNIADEYINHTHPYGHWKDTAIMVKGEAARSFTLMFLQMWNANERKRDFESVLARISSEPVSAPGYVIPYGDYPLRDAFVGKMVYLNILNQAKDYVYIMTPYLILDNEMITALEFAAGRGVDVRMILPRAADHIYASVLAKSHYRELTDAGVKIYEYTPGFIHAKVFLSDDDTAVVGTINLDYRSLYLHYECAALLYQVPAIRDIKEDFRDTFEKSHLITQEDIKNRSFLTKLFGVLLKVAAPLM